MTICNELLNEIYNNPQNCYAEGDYFWVKGCLFWSYLGFKIDKDSTFPKSCLNFWELRKVKRAYKWWCRNADIKNFRKPLKDFYKNTE